MDSLLLGLAVLACPVGMGVMMWMMSRGQRKSPHDTTREQQVVQLREEIEQLKAERAPDRTTGGR